MYKILTGNINVVAGVDNDGVDVRDNNFHLGVTLLVIVLSVRFELVQVTVDLERLDDGDLENREFSFSNNHFGNFFWIGNSNHLVD